jgi:Rieske Fe-S protein
MNEPASESSAPPRIEHSTAGPDDGAPVSATDRGSAVSRRVLIAAAAGLGAGTYGAAACGAPTPATPSAQVTAPLSAAPASEGLRPVPATHAPRPVAATRDIPVGGGRIFPALRVVVTQPVAGQFRGFGIVCTHDGCELNSVAGGTINCPCHGSRFALTDGSVVHGPARTGLRTEKITVDGDRILLL